MASSIHNINICLAFLLILCGEASAQVDLTLTENATGAAVVGAVIEKISTCMPLFSECGWWNMSFMDRTTLKRLLRNAAFVLTEGGNSESGIPEGGLWDIDVSVLNGTSSKRASCNLSDYEEGLNRTNTTIFTLKTNLRKPLYSGLAAALCIHQYLNSTSRAECRRATFLTSIRDSSENRHTVWSDVIGTDLNRATWRDKEDRLQERDREECTIQSDVVFVIDSSLSVLPKDFKEARDFVFNVTMDLLVSDVINGVGVITYGRTARNPLRLTEITSQNSADILATIMNTEQLDGVTNTADGLCLLADQDWRPNPAIIRLAIVLTDGRSNRNATRQDCNGNVEEVARKIKEQPNLRINLMAIGIGDNVRDAELIHIASDNSLVSILEQYSGLRQRGDVFRYQICHAMSANMNSSDQQNGSIGESQTMRWVIRDIHQDGISIRFCVMNGRITFYIAQGCLATNVTNQRSATITLSDKLSIECQTEFFGDITYERRKRQVSQSSAIYLSIEGRDNINTFTVQSGPGNVSFDVDECESTPSPCDKSATCHNTDGSFYCECNLGFSGDGFKCTSYLFQLLVFLVPSVFMGGLLLFACILLIIVGICVCRQKPKSRKRNKKQSDSQKAPDKKVLNLSLSTSL